MEYLSGETQIIFMIQDSALKVVERGLGKGSRKRKPTLYYLIDKGFRSWLKQNSRHYSGGKAEKKFRNDLVKFIKGSGDYHVLHDLSNYKDCGSIDILVLPDGIAIETKVCPPHNLRDLAGELLRYKEIPEVKNVTAVVRVEDDKREYWEKMTKRDAKAAKSYHIIL
jgi:hypothetical protein